MVLKLAFVLRTVFCFKSGFALRGTLAKIVNLATQLTFFNTALLGTLAGFDLTTQSPSSMAGGRRWH
jgi:hypothetical protein